MPKPKRRKARRRASAALPAPFAPGSDIARDLQSLLRSAEARLVSSELPRVLVDVLDDIIAQRDHQGRPRGAIIDHDARRGYRFNPFGWGAEPVRKLPLTGSAALTGSAQNGIEPVNLSGPPP